MRFIIYGTLTLIAAILLFDTNIGHPVDASARTSVVEAIRHVEEHGLADDARLLSDIEEADGFRESAFYSYLFGQPGEPVQKDSFYAYTPLLSRSRIFLGGSFLQPDTIGQASVLIHEGAHIKRHLRRFLRGIPRGDDEAEAYLYQYDTHAQLGLSGYSGDTMVYWDMMIGVRDYVVDRYPQVARRPDVQGALRDLEEPYGRAVTY